MKPSTIRRALQKRKEQVQELKQLKAAAIDALGRVRAQLNEANYLLDRLVRVDAFRTMDEPEIWQCSLRVDRRALDLAKSREGLLILTARILVERILK